MRYYTKKSSHYSSMKIKKPKFIFSIIIIIIILIFCNYILYLFNKRILPSVLSAGELKMKSEVIRIINEESMKVYEEQFKYEDIVNIEKDSEGNITMIRSDTIKQNYLASQIALNCNEKISEFGDIGLNIPLGYVSNNIFFYEIGPDISVKMQPVGSLNTSYESIFESAGINQTRHKIYLNVTTTLKIIVPFNTENVDVTCQIPVSDTVVVGKIPQTSINMNN